MEFVMETQGMFPKYSFLALLFRRGLLQQPCMGRIIRVIGVKVSEVAKHSLF